MAHLWLGACLLLLCPTAAGAQLSWYRGNTHVHTVNSDGTATPQIVVRWYKENGYQFVVLTDHDFRTPVDSLNAVFGEPNGFVVIAGEEITDRFENRPVHINGLNLTETILPQGGGRVSSVIDRNAAATRRAGGLPVLNHPNGVLRRALTAEEIGAADIRHFEVCCADFWGGSGFPSTDEIWDAVLSSGHLIYGIADDDAHRFGANARDPGTAWIMVRAATLTADAVIAALDSGDFYSTTGVALHEYAADDSGVRMTLADTTDYGFRTFFIGQGGSVLKQDESATPTYLFGPSDRYVRARIERSDGAIAWTQPVFRRAP